MVGNFELRLDRDDIDTPPPIRDACRAQILDEVIPVVEVAWADVTAHNNAVAALLSRPGKRPQSC